MAKRKKRGTALKRKSTSRGKARKVSKSVRGKAPKRSRAKARPKKSVAKTKRLKARKVARKKAGPIPITPVVETTVVDVVEEPIPGVITVSEFEVTEIREAGVGPEELEED